MISLAQTKLAETGLGRNKTYRKLFIAYALSAFGDWFDLIAVQIMIAYVWNASPILVGLMPLMYALPGILFGQAAGVIAGIQLHSFCTYFTYYK